MPLVFHKSTLFLDAINAILCFKKLENLEGFSVVHKAALKLLYLLPESPIFLLG